MTMSADGHNQMKGIDSVTMSTGELDNDDGKLVRGEKNELGDDVHRRTRWR